jgi:dienelactone hydrolase
MKVMFSVSMVCEAAGRSLLFSLLLLKQDKAPLLFSVPNTDDLFVPEARTRAIEIMTQHKKLFNMQIFQNVDHGFAVSSPSP